MDNANRLHVLAARYAELSHAPFMEERRAAWTKLHELSPVRPVSILETELMDDFVTPAELTCDTAEARDIECTLSHGIKHVESLDDDYVLPTTFALQASLVMSHADFGVGLAYRQEPETHAVVANHPIVNPDDVARLQQRTYTYDAEPDQRRLGRIQELLGDSLTVVLAPPASTLPQVSRYVYDLVGTENFYLWSIDSPDTLRYLAEFVATDFLNRYQFLEDHGLLTTQHSLGYAGSGSLAFTSSLPHRAPARQSDMWLWLESQETDTISPAMLEDLFLPAMARIADKFGLVYYGCCEHLHDRIDRILQHIPRIRAVSVSPWSDVDRMADALHGRAVFSRKLNPLSICNELHLDDLAGDVSHVLRAVPNGVVEFVYRDVYHWDNPEKFRTAMHRIHDLIA